ncbi:MAG: CoA-binding protein [Alphaproteobacteria bacterium]|nr:CoA-binding protein [Alphaproteobacteria bacterium]
MDHASYSDEYLRAILQRVKCFAMVGASTDWNKPSYFAMKYLQKKGYRVIPVNPKAAEAGEEILGERAYPDLKSVPGRFDMVDVFRNSAAAGPITDEAIALAPEKGIGVVWMQLGVSNPEAAARAEAAGLQVVMNRCPKIEYGRLFGELSWGGFNSGIISSKRRPVRRPVAGGNDA